MDSHIRFCILLLMRRNLMPLIRGCSGKALGTLAAALAAACLFPALLAGQSSARDALTIFPADTQEFAYSNLAELRSQPNFQVIQARLLNSQMRGFTGFLRSMGVDPNNDVDEVTLGWHGSPIDPSAYYGLALGRFDPGKVHNYVVEQNLPWQQYGGYDLYAYGAGSGAQDLYFAFLSYSTAAFGRLGDLKMLLDVRAGSKPALESKASFVKYESELEGTSPQWGIATGPAAANQAAPWLAGGAKLPFDPQSALSPVRAVLYRIDWANNFTMRMSVVCDSVQSATLLARLITAWQGVQQAPGANLNPAITGFVQSLQVSSNGARVELTGSGPVEVLGQILNGPVHPSRQQ
jgi:hypothetical protein